MIYAITAYLFFDEEDEGKDFYHDCEKALPKSKTINPGQPNEIRGHIKRELCHHDEVMPDSCIIIEEQFTPV